MTRKSRAGALQSPLPVSVARPALIRSAHRLFAASADALSASTDIGQQAGDVCLQHLSRGVKNSLKHAIKYLSTLGSARNPRHYNRASVTP
jgi:hypothetical protein